MADKTPETHSKIVGGSTAKRVMNCPGSVRISQEAPPQKSSKYADQGTLLHNVMAKIMSDPDIDPKSLIGTEYEGRKFTQELLEDKIEPAIALLDEFDPDCEMEILVECEVGFTHKTLKGVFGTCDVIGRLPDRAIILDWKFGDGVMVEVEENHQLLFYAAGALNTEKTKDFFSHSEIVELVIVQPPLIRRWETTVERIKEFEQRLIDAVLRAQRKNAPLVPGEWCKWCPGQQVDGKAQVVCPKIRASIEAMENGNIYKTERGMARKDGNQVREYEAEALADALHHWRDVIKPIGEHIETVIREAIEAGRSVPGWKLVQGKLSRDWSDEEKASSEIEGLLQEVIDHDDQIDAILFGEAKLQSVARIEKELKKLKIKLPETLIVKSNGSPSLVPDTDKREALTFTKREEIAEAFGKIAKP